MSNSKKVVIVGGVAGGASAAARARRLSEQSEIVIFERGPYVSFANCGLPYYIGGEIQDRRKLSVQTPESLHQRLNLDVRVNSEVIAIDRAAKLVIYRSGDDPADLTESYDNLILSTGAIPIRPALPGIDTAGIFTLRDIPDTDRVFEWIEKHTRESTPSPENKRAVVIGAGFIGLEMAEQLVHRGFSISILEAAPQILAPLDPEMARIVQLELERHAVRVILGDGVASFAGPTPEEDCKAAVVVTSSGKRLPADLIILGIGVKPETTLAKSSGLELGKSGGILVNERLQTSDPDIYAVGDTVEVRGFGIDLPVVIPLAGPANRQGRIAADNIFGFERSYKGTLGTSIVRVFGLTAACTGANERALTRAEKAYERVYLHPNSHAGYYPGAQPIALKLIFDSESRAILGAQAVGADGVDKRIDVIATALGAGSTIDDLAELELCYAPPFGSAKDPVNLAGMAAQNIADELVEVIHWDQLSAAIESGALLLDVRDEKEALAAPLPGATNIPVNSLRSRIEELDKARPIIASCASGQRSYLACRILSQQGFRCRNLSGAYKTWSLASG